MNTTVERLEGNRVKLTVTVPAEEVDKTVRRAYGKAAEKYRIPGFRKGKAPRPVIDNYVGRETVLGDALEMLVSNTYPRAVSETGLRPIESPDMGELEGVQPGEEYSYVAEVDVKPELKLSSIEDLKVEVGPSKASDEEVDAQIDYMRDRFATLENVEDRGVEADDFVLLSFVGNVEGETWEGNSVDKYLYEMGKGVMPDTFDQGLLGHKPGEKFAVEFEIPETSNVEEFIGKTAHFDVEIHEIKRKVLPEPNDEFAANVGFDTFEEYRNDVRQKLDESKYLSHVRDTERGAVEALAERLEGDIPESMIEERTEQMLRDFATSMDQRGLTFEQYLGMTGMTFQQVREDVGKQAEQSVRQELALEALFRETGMEVSDEDVQAEIADLAGEGVEPERFGENLRASGALPILVEQLMHKRAVRWLMDHVEIIEREPEKTAETEGKPKAEEKPKPKKRARKSEKKEAEAAEAPAEKEE